MHRRLLQVLLEVVQRVLRDVRDAQRVVLPGLALWPSSASSRSPISSLRKVVLPAPLAPRMTAREPSVTRDRRVGQDAAVGLGYLNETSFIVMIGLRYVRMPSGLPGSGKRIGRIWPDAIICSTLDDRGAPPRRPPRSDGRPMPSASDDERDERQPSAVRAVVAAASGDLPSSRGDRLVGGRQARGNLGLELLELAEGHRVVDEAAGLAACPPLS